MVRTPVELRAALARTTTLDDRTALVAEIVGHPDFAGCCAGCMVPLFRTDHVEVWLDGEVSCQRGDNVPGLPSFNPDEPRSWPDAPCYRAGGPMEEIMGERARQVDVEGFGPRHDDEHRRGEIGRAAQAYFHTARRALACAARRGVALSDGGYGCLPPHAAWPKEWHRRWWKPKNPRRDLVRAGALALAERDRLSRAGAPVRLINRMSRLLNRVVDALGREAGYVG